MSTPSPAPSGRRVTVLSGGVGGARFLQGLLTVPGWGGTCGLSLSGQRAREGPNGPVRPRSE